MTRHAISWQGTVARHADGWTVTVPVRRERVTPQVRVVVKERLRIRREVAGGVVWLPHVPQDERTDAARRSRDTPEEHDR